MGQGNEASVEEILESIKKVIARDNREDAMEMRRRRETQGVGDGGVDTRVDGRHADMIRSHNHADGRSADEADEEEVLDLAEKLSGFGSPVTLHIIPFTEIQQEVHKQVPDNITMTSTRRMMMRIADAVRAKTDEPQRGQKCRPS